MLTDFVKLNEELSCATGTVVETSFRRFKLTCILNLLLCTTSQLISECDRITENTNILEMLRRVHMWNLANISEECSNLNFGVKQHKKCILGRLTLTMKTSRPLEKQADVITALTINTAKNSIIHRHFYNYFKFRKTFILSIAYFFSIYIKHFQE